MFGLSGKTPGLMVRSDLPPKENQGLWLAV